MVRSILTDSYVVTNCPLYTAPTLAQTQGIISAHTKANLSAVTRPATLMALDLSLNALIPTNFLGNQGEIRALQAQQVAGAVRPREGGEEDIPDAQRQRRGARRALRFDRPEHEVMVREIDVVNRRRNRNQMEQDPPVIIMNPDGEPRLAQRQVVRDVSPLRARVSPQRRRMNM
jgi:hypothetical protein